MTALALWAKKAGFTVSGSDIEEEFPTDELLKLAKIKVFPGFAAANIQKAKPNLVIYTGAHGGRDNVEVKTALKDDIQAYSHGKALGMAMEGNKQVAVAGSHGKTTTAAMIATILTSAGLNPSYCVGCGEIFGLGAPGHAGKGIFVAEADEYLTDPGHDLTPRFLWQKPEILVVTNIDWDHPDAYSSLNEVQEAFLKLTRQEVAVKLRVVNHDDKASSILLKSSDSAIVSYGFSPKANLQITHVGFGQERTFFALKENKMSVGEFSLKVAGRHNVLNAAAASAACRGLGVSWEDIRAGLLKFAGSRRRFEKIGEIGQLRVYDDYAHHPREIEATLAAAKSWYPRQRIISVFQPHTYSRTKALLTDFARAFNKSDVVIICEIYASARENTTLGISGKTLASAVAQYHPFVRFAHEREALLTLLGQLVNGDEIIVLMGAGNIYTWRKLVIEALKEKLDF